MRSGQGFVSTLETSSIGQTGECSAISLSVGSQADKPIATAGKLHSNMVYFDTHTRKKTSNCTFRQHKCAQYSEEQILETALQKAKGANLYVSLLHAEPQDQGEHEGYDNTSALAAVDKFVAHGDKNIEKTVETEEMEETDETKETIEGKVHSNMVFFDTHTRKKLTIVLLNNASVHSEKEILETALQKAKGVNLYLSLLHAEPQDQGEREGDK
jgi:hypothetical protein